MSTYAAVPSEESPRNGQFQEFGVAVQRSEVLKSGFSWLGESRIVLLGCWLMSCSLFCVVGLVVGLSWSRNLDTLCVNHADLPSPISRDLGLRYHDVKFDAKLMGGSIFRGNASVEVDEAWDSLGLLFKPMIVDESVGIKSGIPAGNAKLPLDGGGGFIAMVQVFHQLHCLNLIRKAAWYNYDYYRDLGEHEFANSPEFVEMHVGHCLDFLRQQLMCTSDISLVPFVWVEGQPGPVIDSSTVHRCKDFDAIKVWTRERQVDENQSKTEPVRRPGDRLENNP